MIKASGIEAPEELEDERYKRLRNLNKRASSNLDKVSRVLEFLELQTIAEEENAFVKVKAKFDSISKKEIPFDSLGDSQTLLLRLVEKRIWIHFIENNIIKRNITIGPNT